MKKVLITGGSHAEIPLIDSAHELGYYVITTGTNEDGLGHARADKYVKGDFSDKDFVLALAKEENVQAIISGCNDFAYLSTAYACEKLGIPGHDTYDTACIIHHKNSFRAIAKKIGVRTPEFAECSGIDKLLENSRKIGYPVVVKPVDLTGGKGITICYNDEEVRQAYVKAFEATREKKLVIVEEYITGSNHGATMLLKNQDPVFIFCDDEQYYAGKYLVSGASTSTSVTDEMKKNLVEDTSKIAHELKLSDGLFHVQFIVDKNGYPVMIDPCRRTPGDLYVLLVQYATGINYALEIAKGELGIPLQENYPAISNNVIRECIMAEETGTLEEIEIHNYIKEHIIYELIWADKGDIIDDTSKYKAGILICQFETAEECTKAAFDFQKYVKLRIKSNSSKRGNL